MVELDGYKPFARQIEIREKQLTDLGTIILKPNNGSIELTTAPAGAKVFQNGDQVGVTPFHREDVPPGSTTFSLIADGYLPCAKEVVIKPGEPTKSEVTLQKPDEAYHGRIADMPIVIKFDADRKSGSIARWILPPLLAPGSFNGDAIAKFSGSWSGSVLRATINEALTEQSNVFRSAESLVIRVSDDGKVATCKLTGGEKTLSGDLASAASVGSLKVNTSPPGATVTLGSVGMKKTPATFNANSGKYSLFIELDGYEPVAREVEATESELN